MLRFPIFRESADQPEQWVNVAPRSVASVLETERAGKPQAAPLQTHDFDSSRTCNHCGVAAERVPGIAEQGFCAARAGKPWGPQKVAVLSMWDGSSFLVPDPERTVAAIIQEAQQPAPKMPAMVTKRKPMV